MYIINKISLEVFRQLVTIFMALAVLNSVVSGQVSLNLTPINPPIQVPTSGGSFEYNITVTNLDSISQSFDVWCMATLPDSSSYGPVLGPVNLTLPGGSSNNRDGTQDVPAGAPAGTYIYHAYIGVYPNTIWSSDSFLFNKMGAPPDTLWTRTFGGTFNEQGRCVKQTTDGGFIIAGSRSSPPAHGADVYLIKTDAQGNEAWHQLFGGINGDGGRCVQQTTEGGFIIAGNTYSYGAGSTDVYLIKTDAQGNETWSRTFGGHEVEKGRSVQQTEDGGYIIAGYTSSFGVGSYDFYLIKTDAQGHEIWSQTFGGIWADMAYSVQQTNDGGYIIAGIKYYNSMMVMPPDCDFYLVKTDQDGNEIWSQTFGDGPGGLTDKGRFVRQTSDGGYILVGQSYCFGPGYFCLIKTDGSGNQVWLQSLGGDIGNRGYSVQQTSDGGYVAAGVTADLIISGTDVYLIKTDPQGNEIWSQTFGGRSMDHGYSVWQNSDGGYIVTGITYSFGAGNSDVYLIRLAPETHVNRFFGIPPAYEVLTNPDDYNPLNQNYPNPFNSMTTLSFALPEGGKVVLNIFDITGSLVATLMNGWREAGVHEVTFDGSGLVSGVYVYKLKAGDFTASGKMVLVK